MKNEGKPIVKEEELEEEESEGSCSDYDMTEDEKK